MTKFVFNKPKILLEADSYFQGRDICISNISPYEQKLLIVMMHMHDMKREERWKWLKENKEEIDYIHLTTVDTEVAWEDIAFFYSNGEIIYTEGIGFGSRRSIKSFKRRLKKFGFSMNLVCDNTLKG